MMDNNNNTAEELPKEPEAVESPKVVGVRFRSCGKVYTFDANNLDLKPGVKVIVDSEMGLSMGFIVILRETGRKPRESLKKIIRPANDKDFEAIENNRALLEEAKAFCVEKARELTLSMKIVTTETTIDKKRLIFYFTADGRIDFRELVRDLASKFKTRIEMRQIGVRDEVKMLGGIGVCGRQTCCNQFLTSFEPITIRMAKQQDLSINQSKLSGICGRLMCCLGYEYREGAEVEKRPRYKKRAAAAVEKQGEKPQEVDLEAVSPDAVPMPGAETTETEKASPAGNGEKGSPREKGGDEKKQPRRDIRRRRRRRKEAPPSGSAEKEQKPSGKTDTPAPAEKKEKSRSFNKRKRFWKKKKKEE